MNSPNPNLNPNDLARTLSRLGFRCLSSELDDFLARAIKGRWDPRTLLEQMARMEEAEKARRSLERRLRTARIGRFKPMADFDWNWPRKIDRPLIETALTLDFIPEGRNLVLLGANGLGKTMITKNIAHAAVLAGFSVLFRTASDLLDDLQSDSALRLRRKLKKYARPTLLCIDEIGYLSYDTHAADLLYEVVNRRYEHRSILVTTNRAFKDWNAVFPNATSIVSLLDRLTHHADLTVIEGQSYRRRESEQESAKRRGKKEPPS
jgi:DNA replication protein DnaC